MATISSSQPWFLSAPLCVLLAAPCFFIAAAQTGSESPGEAAMHRHYDAAYRLQTSGDIQGADREHQLFLAEALHHVANARANVGEYAAAVPLFDEALRLAPADVDLQFDYAKAAMDAEDPQKAENLTVDVLARSADLAPATQSWLLRVHGEALRSLGKQEEALEQFKAAAALDPSFDNVYALGNAYLWLGDKPAGASTYSGIVQKFGDTAFVRMSLGRGYAQANDLTEAMAEFSKALAMDSHLRGAHYSLGAADLSLNGPSGYDRAEVQFREELAVNPDDPFSCPQLGKIALDRQIYPEAEKYLRRAIALNPDSPDNQLLIAQLYSETDRQPEAIAALRKAIALTLDPSRNHYAIHAAHYQLGRLLIKTGDIPGGKKEMQIAEDLLARSDQQDKNTLDGKPQVQLPLTTTRVPSAAEKAEEAAYEKTVAPLLAGSYNNLGVHAAMVGDYVAAAGSFRAAAQWNPELAGVQDNWGRAAFAAHQYADAVAPLRHTLSSHPANREARVELGVSQYETGDYGGVVQTLRPIASTLAADPSLAALYAESQTRSGTQRQAKPTIPPGAMR